ncbi:MAG: hypothetical protein CMJ23_02445 [Phycisphaerae bacterium]|nr:hypothetical protein [Phycisphaerae bacterium]
MHDQNPPQPTDTSGSDTPSETPEGTSSGGDVLSLIADVERHLERIRNVQTRQTTDFADLAERQRRVSVAEAEMVERGRALETSARDLGIARETIESDRKVLEEDRIRLEDHRATVERESANADRVGTELESVRTELEEERERLGELEDGLVTRTTAFEHREVTLQAREDELVNRLALAEAAATAATEAMEDARATFDERLSAIEEERQSLLTREETFEHRLAEAEVAHREASDSAQRFESELAEARAATERAQEAAEVSAQQGEEARCSLESLRLEVESADLRVATLEASSLEESEVQARMRGSLEERIVELEDQCVASRDAVSSSQEAIAAAEARTAEAGASLETARMRVESLEQRIAEDERQLGLAGSKLTELARVISEQAPRLEQGAEAMALVAVLETEIARLRAEADGEVEVDEAAMDSLRSGFEGRINELESALQAARSEAKADDGIDADAAVSMIAEARAPLEDRIAELEGLLADAGNTETESGVASDDVVSREKYEAVKDRCIKAERRSDELDTALAMTNDRGQAQEMAKRLRTKAERVSEFARHLDRRRNRLAALRSAMGRRRGAEIVPEGNATYHELQRLEAQRLELSQVREFLGRSEQQMVRRWARPRSVATVAWVLVILGVSVAAGWFGTREFVPIPGTATVSLVASAAGGAPLTGEVAESWDAWHRALATDPAFIAIVQKRLAARGIAPEGGEAATGRMLEEDLSFEDEGSGRLRLVLSGTDTRRLEPTLDAIATTMASESARQAPRRQDGARATLPTERLTGRGVAYASVVGGGMGEAALIRMGGITASVFLASLLLIGVLYAFLSRAKRIFEAQEAVEESVENT